METVPSRQGASALPRAYTGQDARDFAKIWLAMGVTAAEMRDLAGDPGHIARVRASFAAAGLGASPERIRRRAELRAAAAAQLEAEGFDAAAYAAELGFPGGAR